MARTLNEVWLSLLQSTISAGRLVAPRGKPIFERDHVTIAVDMRYPVLTVPPRKLSYRGLAAEAYWILSGSDRLEDISSWLPRYREFSDDGVLLAGAYGPRFVAQLDYVINTLLADRDTRRATMTFWRPRPSSSKDIPCTVGIDFKIRDDTLNAHVFMRSSDVWLGVPYDVFSFAMMACRVLELYNVAVVVKSSQSPIGLGKLWLTAASSHLYEANVDDARHALREYDLVNQELRAVPIELYDPGAGIRGTEPLLLERLRRLRDAPKGDPLRWW